MAPPQMSVSAYVRCGDEGGAAWLSLWMELLGSRSRSSFRTPHLQGLF